MHLLESSTKKFLGHMIDETGIKENPTKFKVMLDMKSLTTVK